MRPAKSLSKPDRKSDSDQKNSEQCVNKQYQVILYCAVGINFFTEYAIFQHCKTRSFYLLFTENCSTLHHRIQFVQIILYAQGFDNLINLALHNIFEVVKRQVDSMVCHPALRKVIGTNFSTAVAG